MRPFSFTRFFPGVCAALLAIPALAEAPVSVRPVGARHGIVVAGHPQAAEAGRAVLQAGGNAIDAAVATSLALGVAEPYASGLGGGLMLLYYDASSGRTQLIEAMDEAGSLDVKAYLMRPADDRSLGCGSVCVPGLAAGLWAAHQKWGARKWADDVQPAIVLARDGALVLSKTRDSIERQIRKLCRGDAEIAKLFLPGSAVPAVGARLANPDLARTMESLAQGGRAGFYQGAVAASLLATLAAQGGVITADDFAGYQARVGLPAEIEFHGYHLVGAPPPVGGTALLFTALKVLENEAFDGGPLRQASNLDTIGNVWRVVAPLVDRLIGDTPEAPHNFETLVAPDSINAIRTKLVEESPALKSVSAAEPDREDVAASTTHFIVVDERGDVVCATQSLGSHFGAGVVAAGTGVVLNDSMSDFVFDDAGSPNYVAPGRRPRSAIAPTIVFRAGRPALAIGAPGGERIASALLQVLIDRLVLDRPLGEAIGDTRFHFMPESAIRGATFESEDSLAEVDEVSLRRFGWRIERSEPAGAGRRFGGVNAVEFGADGSLTGFADPRRTNAVAGY